MRTTEKLVYGYKFRHFPEFNASSDVFTPSFDDSSWETVRIPHDWAICGEFKEYHDCSYSAVAADGITAPIEHSGRTGALPIVGLGVYRRWIDIPEADRGQRIFLEFDGVMWESEIYINGQKVHFNHFGYKSFSVEISDYLEYGQKNLIAVAASVFTDCSRWYPGAGIFRNVYLVKKAPVHIKYNGVWIRQLEIAADSAVFELSVDYAGPETVSFQADILSPDGVSICQVKHNTYYGELSDIFTISNVRLWDVEAPNLYTANIRLLSQTGDIVDEVAVKFGARQCVFTSDHGMILNGKSLKIKGVCNHHDLGSLGAAVNIAALRRQLVLMKQMGVNSIRTSHNPPSPELLDLCDEMGFLVMDEFFDEWQIPKIQNGYAKYFREHAIEDMKDVIHRDRNHPCIILWSLGNEILEQTDPEGWRTTKWLYEAARRFDPTRPITCGFSYPHEPFDNHMINYVDVVGINYKPHLYKSYHRDHPQIKLVATETASTVSTRGIYHLPAEIHNPPKAHDDLTVSAYEMDAPSWAYYAERELAAQCDCEFVAGEYVWTGIDYLGEPTPYYTQWPSRSSYFGAVDIAGLPKNRFYMYRAHWTSEPVLHIFPHWNWEGREGQEVPVHVYTNYPKVELFVNGISYGCKTFRENCDGGDLGQIERFRLMWDHVIYSPGTVTAVAYHADGTIAEQASVHTAGTPEKILLQADRSEILADGDDLVYVTAIITDKNEVPCPHAANRLFFDVSENIELLTTDNGDQRETETFWQNNKKALAGYCVACCRSIADKPGTVSIRVRGDHLQSAEITLKSL